jgi:hypothetical protein
MVVSMHQAHLVGPDDMGERAARTAQNLGDAKIVVNNSSGQWAAGSGHDEEKCQGLS